MPYLNADVPEFECWVRKEFLHDLQAHFGEHERAVVFGISSIEGRALGFHAQMDNGAIVWRLPIHSLCHDKKAPSPNSPGVLQLWDCFSYHVSVCKFNWLEGCRMGAMLPDGKLYGGQYMFTVDWCGSSSSERPGDTGHKCTHLIRLDNGNYAAQPNNRVVSYDPSFVVPFTAAGGEKPDYLTNTREWKCEVGDKWRTSDDDRMFYGVELGS